MSSITSYNQDFCEIVVDVLFDRIKKGKTDKVKKINISTELVKNKSVGQVER